MGEFISYDRIAEQIAYERSKGRSIALTGGCFDLVHRGHRYFLEMASGFGDILVVNVVNDKRVKSYKGSEEDKRPINLERRRAELVAGLEGVTYSTVNPDYEHGPTIGLAILIKPNAVIKGGLPWGEEEKKRLEELLGYLPLLAWIPKRDFPDSTSAMIEKIKEES